jgi:hypothetical protein
MLQSLTLHRRMLHVAVPWSVLVQADEIIE